MASNKGVKDMEVRTCDCDEAEGSHGHCVGCDCVLRWDESEKYCASCEKSSETVVFDCNVRCAVETQRIHGGMTGYKTTLFDCNLKGNHYCAGHLKEKEAA